MKRYVENNGGVGRNTDINLMELAERGKAEEVIYEYYITDGETT